MIEVVVRSDSSDTVLARVQIRNTNVNPDGSADYMVKIMTERGTAVGLHRRSIWSFPRKRLNALALVLQALNTLDEKELELEDGFDVDTPLPADLVGRLTGARKALRGQLNPGDYH